MKVTCHFEYVPEVFAVLSKKHIFGRGAFASEFSGGEPVMVRNEFCKIGGNTLWDSEDIWLRRTVELPADIKHGDVYVDYTHDDGAEIYINGIKIVATEATDGEYRHEKIPADVLATLSPGNAVVAAHCRNAGGYGVIDFGLSYQTRGVVDGVSRRCSRLDFRKRKTHGARNGLEVRYRAMFPWRPFRHAIYVNLSL